MLQIIVHFLALLVVVRFTHLRALPGHHLRVRAPIRVGAVLQRFRYSQAALWKMHGSYQTSSRASSQNSSRTSSRKLFDISTGVFTDIITDLITDLFTFIFTGIFSHPHARVL
eukprot:TRINITY_DN24150_c0_g1_i1.p3 TRINITY_DN24150_c0_g1~~TRINITY_DN24150_c0_g1_i1.p3  ORF type:complete len:113 (+),score=8.93 TRINITY_DN24150_c0_g1_i1:230-568(+)